MDQPPDDPAPMLSDRPFSLGPWRVDPVAFEMRRGGAVVRLEPKTMAVLVHLAERAGTVVSRDELLGAVWPDVVVTDASLTRCVSQLRQVLDDDARTPKWIETIPKAGYRLLVTPDPVAADAPPRLDPDPPPVARRRLVGWGVVVAGLGVLALAIGPMLWTTPVLAVTYRVDLVGDAEAGVVTYTGPDGLPVTVRPTAFPFTARVVPSEPAGTFRLQVRGESTGADLVLSIVARRGSEEVARQETTGAVGPGSILPFSTFALLTVEE